MWYFRCYILLYCNVILIISKADYQSRFSFFPLLAVIRICLLHPRRKGKTLSKDSHSNWILASSVINPKNVYLFTQVKNVILPHDTARLHTTRIPQIGHSFGLFHPIYHIQLTLHQLIINFFGCFFDTLMMKTLSSRKQIPEFNETISN